MRLDKIRRLSGGREIYYYDTSRGFQAEKLAQKLYDMIAEELAGSEKEGILLLCIGTDRSTGDSLGPLIGHKLSERGLRNLCVIGTLQRPVHAMNLEQAVQMVRMHYSNYLVVAIDASVGSADHVGYITLGRGSLKPGLGVCKELQAVGDIFLTGIVGGYAGYDPLMLQSVRLSIVMRMADCICDSLCIVEELWKNTAFV